MNITFPSYLNSKYLIRYINYSNWNRNNQTSTIINNNIVKSFPIIDNILSNSCKFFVVCKNDECAPQIILESIEMLYKKI